MIKNCGAGWAHIKIGDFEGSASYLRSTPEELLLAFLHFYEEGIGSVYFDEEGSSFILTLSADCYDTFVIERREEERLHIIDISAEDIVKEGYEDIKKDVEGWAEWSCTSDEKEEYEEHLANLEILLGRLKEYVN